MIRPFDRVIATLFGETLQQMLRFGVVGTLGFVVDSGVLMTMLAFGIGPYAGRFVSYVAAASLNWGLNRVWTFRGRNSGSAHIQWLRFLAVNLVGFCLNYGTYALLLARVPPVAAFPVLGVAAGSLVGMLGNFMLSRRYVFRAAPSAEAFVSPESSSECEADVKSATAP